VPDVEVASITKHLNVEKLFPQCEDGK